MALPRKHIPLTTRLIIAKTQLGEMWVSEVVTDDVKKRNVGTQLDFALERLADLLGCTRSELRLDHNPALGLRRKIKNRAGEIVAYDPPEHDPKYLIYRSHADHHRKTNIRGDGAQFSDTVLMKRERRRQKKETLTVTQIKRGAHSAPKTKVWPKGRKIESRGFR